MRTRWITTFATLAVLAACAQSEPNDSARPAPGGNAPDVSAGGGRPVDASPPPTDSGQNPDACVSSSPECCPPPEFPGCETLSEVACGESMYCFSIIGYLCSPPNTDAGVPDATFLACRPLCFGTPEIMGMAYDPNEPSQCYMFAHSYFPEGWVEVPYGEVLPGMCGT
jgi:hypothetical protein